MEQQHGASASTFLNSFNPEPGSVDAEVLCAQVRCRPLQNAWPPITSLPRDHSFAHLQSVFQVVIILQDLDSISAMTLVLALHKALILEDTHSRTQSPTFGKGHSGPLAQNDTTCGCSSEDCLRLGEESDAIRSPMQLLGAIMDRHTTLGTRESFSPRVGPSSHEMTQSTGALCSVLP